MASETRSRPLGALPDNARARAEALRDIESYPDVHEIVPGRVWLGAQGVAGIGVPDADPADIFAALTDPAVRGLAITHIVNCTGDQCVFRDRGVVYWMGNLPHKQERSGVDGWDDIDVALPSAVAFIEAAVGAGGRVFVHCNNGQNRSAAVVTAYVMKSYGWGFDKAYMAVRGLRALVQTKLEDALLAYEATLASSGELQYWEPSEGVPSLASAGTSAEGEGRAGAGDTFAEAAYVKSRPLSELRDNEALEAAFLVFEGDPGYRAMHQVADAPLYVGTQRAAGVVPHFEADRLPGILEELQRNGITHVVNCIGEDRPFADHMEYFNIKDWGDRANPHDAEARRRNNATFLQSLSAVFEFIDAALAGGHGVLVHCNAGQSRSGSVAIAHLMRSRGWRFEEAYLSVVAARPVVNPRFSDILIEYERQIIDPAFTDFAALRPDVDQPTCD